MTNCLFYAVALFWRRRGKAERRYFLVRWSDLALVPHFLYGELRRGHVRTVSWKPFDKRKKLIPPPVFAGKPCWGDVKGGARE